MSDCVAITFGNVTGHHHPVRCGWCKRSAQCLLGTERGPIGSEGECTGERYWVWGTNGTSTQKTLPNFPVDPDSRTWTGAGGDIYNSRYVDE